MRVAERGNVKNVHTVRTGIEYMMFLAEWYRKESAKQSIGQQHAVTLRGDERPKGFLDHGPAL